MSEDKFEEFMREKTGDSKFCLQPAGIEIQEEVKLVEPPKEEAHQAVPIAKI